MIILQNLGEYAALRLRVGWTNIICVSVSGKQKKKTCVRKRAVKERHGRLCYASNSQYACRLEDVWLLWLAVPCVTAFKNSCQEKCLLYRL